MSVRRESAGEVDLCDSSWSCPGSSKDAPYPRLDRSYEVIFSAYRSLLLQLNTQKERKTEGNKANREVKQPCHTEH